jgi:2-oxoisovalerate dehydrogenase E1 component alpha subunit
MLRRLPKLMKPLVKPMAMPVRSFSILDKPDKSLFEYKFTNDMDFRSSFDKIKCFRVIDEEGEVVNPGYAEKIPKDTLLKIYDNMVTMNEADLVYNAAQRQSRISFYMTQLGEEASGIGTAAALNDDDLLFP